MKKLFFFIPFLLSLNLFSQDKTLDISPVYQETQVWCWVSVGEMIFKYYDVCCINPGGDYQCGIIALLGPACNNDCRNCIVPAGSSQVIQNMLREYPRYARQVCGSNKYSVSSTIRYSKASRELIIDEIDNDRPIIAGISPSGGYGASPAHVALIIGYEADNTDFILIVNDPFPYELFSSPDPYLTAGGEFIESGKYKISYSDFTKLRWTQSFVNIK